MQAKGGDFVALFGPHGGAFAAFFRQNPDKRPGGGRGTHGIDWDITVGLNYTHNYTQGVMDIINRKEIWIRLRPVDL
jgi:hypothetical protein